MAAPVNIIIAPEAYTDKGFQAYKTISGVGLNTFGFLWALEDIWQPAEIIPMTVWSNCSDDVGLGSPT